LKIPIRPQRQERPRRSGSRDRDRGGDRRSQRRNSESSLRERVPPLTEEERKERDRRRKERESRHRDKDESIASTASTKTSSRSRRRVHVDVVDQMDVTGGLYGVKGSKLIGIFITFLTNQCGTMMDHLMPVDPIAIAKRITWLP
jgi:hypothetical protein